MARIKFDLPERMLLQVDVPVRIHDINYGGHLGHDRILTLAHEARMSFFHSLGYKEETNIEKLGIVVADAAIMFQNESFYGDTLSIQLGLNDFNKYGFDIVYQLNSGDKAIARAKTGIVFFDYQARKISPPPEPFINKLKEKYGPNL